MNINSIFSNLDLLNLYLPIIALSIPYIYKFFKVFNSEDIELNKENRILKNFLRSSLNFLFIFLFFFFILSTLSIQIIQSYNMEWEMVENKNSIYITCLLFYSLVSSILAGYSLIIFSNFKQETFLLLEGLHSEKKFKIINKVNEQDIVIIKYQDPEKLDTVYEKAFDIKEEALIYQSVSKNFFKQDFYFIKIKAPRLIRWGLMILILLVVAVSTFYTYSVISGFIELSSFINGFSFPLLWICLIISLTSIVPIVAGIIFLIKAYKSKWYK